MALQRGVICSLYTAMHEASRVCAVVWDVFCHARRERVKGD